MRKTTLNSSKRKGMNRAQRRSSKTLAERKRAHVQQLIKEEMLMIEQHIRTGEIVAREEQRMLREGYSRDEINEANMDFLGKIPVNIDIRTAADNGKPLFEKNPEHEISKIFKEIANKIKQSFR